MLTVMTFRPERPGATKAPPVSLPLVALVGMALALFGVYWDDAWHTDRGRDTLVSPPHVALYVGVTMALVVVAASVFVNRRLGWRRLIADTSGIGVLGALAVVGSAPVDEWWHQAFGRDAVLWSPPHLFAVVGTIALATALASMTGSSHRPLGPARWIRSAAGAPVIGAWLVLVLEYDTDVPQFSPAWYLPVLATALAAAGVTVQAASRSGRFAAVSSGVVYTLAMVAVTVGLDAGGFSTPIIPVVLPALLVADLTARRQLHGLTRTALFTAAVFAVYVPYLRVVPGGVTVDAGDILVGLPVAASGVAVAIAGLDRSSLWTVPTIRPAALAVAIMAIVATVLVVSPSRVEAHDPGQGEELTAITLRATVAGDEVIVETFDLVEPFDLERLAIVARRAGRTVSAPLGSGPQGWVGSIELDVDGRWFVYVTARAGELGLGETVEAWIPVEVGSRGVAVKQTTLYRTSDQGTSEMQLAVGALVVAASFAVLIGVAAAVRQPRAGTASADRVATSQTRNRCKTDIVP